jgi:hypothetical protein
MNVIYPLVAVMTLLVVMCVLSNGVNSFVEKLKVST